MANPAGELLPTSPKALQVRGINTKRERGGGGGGGGGRLWWVFVLMLVIVAVAIA